MHHVISLVNLELSQKFGRKGVGGGEKIHMMCEHALSFLYVTKFIMDVLHHLQETFRTICDTNSDIILLNFLIILK